MSEDDLWIKGQSDDLNVPASRRAHAADSARHIGCPLSWFTLVFPLVRGKNELAVALYIYRLRTIQRSRTIKVSNTRLLTEMGIDRFAKYRALRRLAVAGIITVKSYPQRSLEVVFHRRRSRAK